MDPAQNPPSQPPQTQTSVPASLVGQIQSTEIPIAEAKKLEHAAEKSKKKKKIIIILGTVFFVMILLLSLPIMLTPNAPPPTPTPTPTATPTPYVSTILPIDAKHNEQVLVGSVPHFLTLELSDLPNIYDIRGIFPYKNNLILVAGSGITEYNPQKLNIVRQNNPDVLGCITNGAVIGNKLYVGCNGSVENEKQPKGVYMINLDNGKLETIFTEGSSKLDFVTVAATSQAIWVGTSNSIVKIDAKSNIMEEFIPEKVGVPGCKNFSLFSYHENVWTTCVTSSSSHASIYDAEKNTWSPFTPPNSGTDKIYTLGYNPTTILFSTESSNPTVYTYHTDTKSWDQSPSSPLRIPSSKPEAEEMRGLLRQNNMIFAPLGQKGIAYLSYFDPSQKKVVDFELVISPYIGFSDIINQKRYLFTQKSIDTLKNFEFPKAFKKLNGEIASTEKIFIDPKESYAVLIGTHPAKNPPFSAQLINLKKGEIINLVTEEELKSVKAEKMAMLVELIPNSTLVGDSKIATLRNSRTNEVLMEINFEQKRMSISYNFK